MKVSTDHINGKLENRYLLDVIFRRLYFQGGQSCAGLSRWLNKSVPLVTKELNHLIAEGYVTTDGYAPSTGGRRATRYSLNPAFGYVVAVSMDQLFTVIAIFDLARQQVVSPETFELDLHQTKDVLPFLAKKIQACIAGSSIPPEKILGVGVAMPGFINKEKGINHTFFNQGLPYSHRELLQRELNLPVFLDNDSSLTALAEWIFGRAKGTRNAMIVNIGWGTGLGMIVNGELVRGELGYAGEFSHIPVSDNGILCECGKRGCLETQTSLLIMAQKAIDEINKGHKTGIELKDVKYMSDNIIDAALNGNQFCIDLISQMGLALGKGIAILIHIMNPGSIVLSGRGARAESILMAPVQHALHQYCIPRLAENTKVEISTLGQEAPLIGAAALVIENCTFNEIHKKVS